MKMETLLMPSDYDSFFYIYMYNKGYFWKFNNSLDSRFESINWNRK
jgi:hypothetical protein